MMTGMNFGMDGPQVTGWWYNPTTGDKFNALDTYFEDNNLLIKTADGRLLNYNQIQNYVHVEDPKTIPDKSVSKAKPQTEEIPAEVLAEIDNGEGTDGGLLIPEDNIYGRPLKQTPATTDLGNIYSGREAAQPAIQDFAIIDRALAGKNNPSPSADISWPEFPKKEIEMLIDVMNISEDEIIQYYINNVSMDVVKNMVEEGIRNYIKLTLSNPQQKTNNSKQSSTDSTETKSKKKTTSKSK